MTTDQTLTRGRVVTSVPSEFLTPKDNRIKTKLLMAKQAAICSGQIFDKLPENKKHLWLTLAENQLATVERLAKVSW